MDKKRLPALSVVAFLLAVGACGAPDMPKGIPFLACDTARAYGLSPALVRAVIEVESQWYPKATSYDGRTLKRKAWAWDVVRRHRLDPADRLTWSSVGLMQISVLVAYDLGYRGDYKTLYLPATNLKYGCMRLAQCKRSHPRSIRKALWRYNQSTVYIDTVVDKYLEYMGGVP